MNNRIIPDFVKQGKSKSGKSLSPMLSEGNYLCESLEGDDRSGFIHTWQQRYDLGQWKMNTGLVEKSKAILDFIKATPSDALLFLHIHSEKIAILIDIHGNKFLEMK